MHAHDTACIYYTEAKNANLISAILFSACWKHMNRIKTMTLRLFPHKTTTRGKDCIFTTFLNQPATLASLTSFDANSSPRSNRRCHPKLALFCRCLRRSRDKMARSPITLADLWLICHWYPYKLCPQCDQLIVARMVYQNNYTPTTRLKLSNASRLSRDELHLYYNILSRFLRPSQNTKHSSHLKFSEILWPFLLFYNSSLTPFYITFPSKSTANLQIPRYSDTSLSSWRVTNPSSIPLTRHRAAIVALCHSPSRTTPLQNDAYLHHSTNQRKKLTPWKSFDILCSGSFLAQSLQQSQFVFGPDCLEVDCFSA